MSSPNDTEKSILATSKAFDDALAARDVSKLRGTLAAGGAVLHHGVYIHSFQSAAVHPIACASALCIDWCIYVVEQYFFLAIVMPSPAMKSIANVLGLQSRCIGDVVCTRTICAHAISAQLCRISAIQQ